MGPNVAGRADEQVVQLVRDRRELAGESQRACGFEVGGWAWFGGGLSYSGVLVWNSGRGEVGGAWA